jgi:hypothetical protein
MNLLKANWTGKVGQTVGAKWKNKSTIRSFTKPSYTDTPAQQTVRAGFGAITSYVALFADQIKALSALDTKGMSVRNAIIKLNKAQVSSGALDPATLQISRGGLPIITGAAAVLNTQKTILTFTWNKAEGATISAKAKVVVIVVDDQTNFAAVSSVLNTEETLAIPAAYPTDTSLNIHFYLVDYRGSSRVGSPSGYLSVAN